MSEQPSSELIDAICKFVAEETNYPCNKLTPETRIGSDLGVAGDDASDLMEHFAERFDVDLKEFVFTDYFGSEGSALFIVPAFFLMRLVPSYRKRRREKDRHEITILHLALCAKAGHWLLPVPEPKRPKPRPGFFQMGCIGVTVIISAVFSIGPLLVAIWLAIAGKIGVAVLLLMLFAFIVWSANRLVHHDLRTPAD